MKNFELSKLQSWIDSAEDGQHRRAEFREGGLVHLVRSIGKSHGRIHFGSLADAVQAIDNGFADRHWTGTDWGG